MATTTQKSPLKTFHGASMAEALALVKRELGPDAVILHTRSFRDGGMLGLGARDVVEITASADASVVRPRRPRSPAAAQSRTPDDTAPAQPPATARGSADKDAGFIATPPWFSRVGSEVTSPAERGTSARTGTGRPKPEARGKAETDTDLLGLIDLKPLPARHADSPVTRTPPASIASENTPAAADARQTVPRRVNATRVTPAPVTPEARTALSEELTAIRRLVGQVLQSSRRTEARTAAPAGADAGAGPLLDISLRLMEHQVATEAVDEIVAAVRDALTPAELRDEGVVLGAVLRQLGRSIPVADSTRPPGRRDDGRPGVVAMIGPTGVGKTTTVAKLAATCKLRYGQRVGLIAADTYRIAAVEQLRTYAEIVGIPMRVVLAPDDVPAALDSLAECDTVLIDTAGRSQRDSARLDELRDMLAVAAPDQTHLVLSLVAADSVIAAAAERYGQLAPDRLVLTKLDEAVDFGVILNTARRVGLPVSFVTTGQEVPDDIEPADADRLARLVLHGEHAGLAAAGER